MPLPTQASESSTVPDSTINLLNAMRTLRSAGGALFTQAALLGQLAQVEWAEEKARLLTMMVFALLGFAALLCLMICAGALVLACVWETAYRLHVAMILLALYGFITGLAWRRLQALATIGGHSFAATRAEFSADLALLKGKL